MDKELRHYHLEVNKNAFKQACCLVADLSDINKPYAEKMEGLDIVHDGSTGDLCNGYWQLNIIGVDEAGISILPMISSLYATEKECGKGFSENKKKLESTAIIKTHIKKDQILVFDRGGDRSKLMYRWIDQKQHFIIRQTGLRNIFVKDEEKNLKKYGKSIDRSQSITVRKRRKNRIRARTFECGARQVYLPHEYGVGPQETALWLVSAKEHGKGWCWFQCSIPAENEAEALRIAMQGYGYRWKIEEVHRQIKTSYNLEEICLRRYTVLNNFNVIFWIATSFLYQHLDGLSIDIVQHTKDPMVYRPKKLREYIGFVYYKLSKALKAIFSGIKLRKLRLKDKYKIVDQLGLVFE